MITKLKIIAEIVELFGIGFGAFFGGVGGLTAFWDWRNKKISRKHYIDNLRKKYPRSKLNKNFQIIQKESKLGWIFLLDKNINTKFWIKDVQALRDLGFSSQDVTTIEDSKSDEYPQGDEIVAMKDII